MLEYVQCAALTVSAALCSKQLHDDRVAGKDMLPARYAVCALACACAAVSSLARARSTSRSLGVLSTNLAGLSLGCLFPGTSLAWDDMHSLSFHARPLIGGATALVALAFLANAGSEASRRARDTLAIGKGLVTSTREEFFGCFVACLAVTLCANLAASGVALWGRDRGAARFERVILAHPAHYAHTITGTIAFIDFVVWLCVACLAAAISSSFQALSDARVHVMLSALVPVACGLQALCLGTVMPGCGTPATMLFLSGKPPLTYYKDPAAFPVLTLLMAAGASGAGANLTLQAMRTVAKGDHRAKQ